MISRKSALEKLTPALQHKDNNNDKNNLELLKAVMPANEAMQRLVKEATGELSPYFLKIVEMGIAKPLHSIVFAPHIEQHITINIDSNNETAIDTSHKNCGNTTVNDDHRIWIDARRKNCDNVKIKNSSKSFVDNSIYQKLISFYQDCGNDYRNAKIFKSLSSKLKLKE